MSFHYVETRVFCLATEDEGKVKQALLFVIGDPLAELEEQNTKGFHRNPIKIFSYKLSKNKQIKQLFSRLGEAGLLDTLLETLHDRFDEELALNFRLNKQEASLEKLVIYSDTPKGGAISIRAKAKAFPNKHEVGLEMVKEYLEGLS